MCKIFEATIEATSARNLAKYLGIFLENFPPLQFSAFVCAVNRMNVRARKALDERMRKWVEREKKEREEGGMGRIKQPFSAGYSRNRPLFITGTPHSDANPGQFGFKKTYDPGTEHL